MEELEIRAVRVLPADPQARLAQQGKLEQQTVLLALLGLLGLLALRMALQAPLVLLDRLVPKVLLAILAAIPALQGQLELRATKEILEPQAKQALLE